MKTLDTQSRLEYARAAIAVLRTLKLLDTKIQYNQFARAIGLMTTGEKWGIHHREHVSDILKLIEATQAESLDYDRGALE